MLIFGMELSWVEAGLIGVILYLCYKLFEQTTTPPPKPVQLPPKKPRPEPRDFTLEELRKFDGRTPETPIYIGVKGKVFDVSNKRDFYGPEGSYRIFAGRDASRALAKGSLSIEDVDNNNIEDLTADEKTVLNEWEGSYDTKYYVVGHIKQ